MRQLIILLLITLALSAPYELIKFTISSYIMPNKNLQMEMDVVSPRTPNSYPPILYLTGLAGLTPSYFQQALIDSIAEKGFVFMTVLLCLFRFLKFKALIHNI